MIKKIKLGIFLVLIWSAAPSSLFAYEDVFNVSIGYGSKDVVEVEKLQNFLFTTGYLKIPATGNYLSMTSDAVKEFQKHEGVEATGYFGPRTRAAANAIILNSSIVLQEAAVEVSSVRNSNSNISSLLFSNQKVVNWKTSLYPKGVGVNINLLKKISNSPKSYTFVRAIATETSNDGEEKWIPKLGELTGDLYVEVACSKKYSFEQGCSIAREPIQVK